MACMLAYVPPKLLKEEILSKLLTVRNHITCATAWVGVDLAKALPHFLMCLA